MTVTTNDPGMIGYGSTFEVETAAGSGVYFKLGLIGGITPPNESVDQVDVTHTESDARTRQFIAGLRDPGDASCSVNYVAGNATDVFVLAWRASGETRSCRITYPTLVKDTFPAFVLGWSPTLATADKCSADLKIKVAGAPVRS